MSAAARGKKRTCQGCSESFYDLNKDPAVCPHCGHSHPQEAFLLAKKSAPEPAAKPKAKPAVDDDVDVDDDLDDDDVLNDDDDLDDDDDDAVVIPKVKPSDDDD
jgi:hypothetical protein